MPALPAVLRPRERLKGRADYQRVFRRGLRLDGPLFLMIAAANECGFLRLGLAASRRIGGAVKRNRAKRLLRESFRRNKPAGLAADLVLVPKAEILARRQPEVESEFRARLRALRARPVTRNWGASAPAPD